MTSKSSSRSDGESCRIVRSKFVCTSRKGRYVSINDEVLVTDSELKTRAYCNFKKELKNKGKSRWIVI